MLKQEVGDCALSTATAVQRAAPCYERVMTLLKWLLGAIVLFGGFVMFDVHGAALADVFSGNGAHPAG